MKLSTVVPVETSISLIDYDSKIVLLGSCFTENIGARLSYFGFCTTVNPFGIIFNSTSLRALIDRAVTRIAFTQEDCTEYFSYLAHSDLNASSPDQLLTKLNDAREVLENAIKNATHLFITLGTAWVYRHIERNMIVANCHKQPQKKFTKELQTIETITSDLNQISQHVKSIKKDVSITYTLSPVRHIKDGFINNQRSKARLHEAIHSHLERTNETYFPAYEIAMDELRDYRFYKRDMVHLNDVGIDFIWSRFGESGINTNTITQQKAVEKYRKLIQHKPTDHQAHKIQVQKMKEELLRKFPKTQL